MICGVVVAAGASTRFGEPKQLLDVRGRPLLQHVVDAASAVLDQVVVVLGHRAADVEAALSLPSNARVVINPAHHEGQASSLQVGLAACDPSAEAAAILLGDQPTVTADLIRRVVFAWRARSEPVVRPVFRGIPGHPVVAARSAWDLLLEARGDGGAGAALARDRDRVHLLELDEPPPPDVDTRADYEALLRGPGGTG